MILQGLGATVEPLKTTLNEMECHPVSKTKFTMLVPDVVEALGALKSKMDVDTVILCGIETHVCIVATCIDLLDRGFNVSLFNLIHFFHFLKKMKAKIQTITKLPLLKQLKFI